MTRHLAVTIFSVVVLPIALGVGSTRALELSVPLACELGNDCFIQNYVDLDPAETVRTVDCGHATYDGHKGTDFRVLNTEATSKVLAAAPGQVRALRNDMPDRLVRTEEDRQAVRNKECGNGVVISHGDGWETQYCHLRRGSVSVSVGENVEQGQPVGQVGYSGYAAFAHVHLTVRKDGKTVDPFLGTVEATQGRLAVCNASAAGKVAVSGQGLWKDTSGRLLQDAIGALVEVGFAGNPVRTLDLETSRVTGPAATAPALVFFARLINLKQGDRVALTLTGPEGEVATSEGEQLDRNKAQWVAFAGRKTPPGGWPAGAYEGEAVLWRDGKEMLRESARFNMTD